MFKRTHDNSDSGTLLLGWVFPLTYLLHILEEYWSDFPSHLLHTQGVALSMPRFLILQSIGLSLMILGVILSRRLGFPNRLLLILAGVIAGNSLVHLFRSIWFEVLEPGLITSLFLWLPLATLTLFRGWPSITRSRYVISVCIGLAISAAVEIVTIS